MAMIQASTNFSHLVAHRKAEGHRLVKEGVYAYVSRSCPPECVFTFDHRWFRHPSYTGFFYWAIGTQMVLQNHVCFIVFAYLLWGFFSSRIRCECSPQLPLGFPLKVLTTDEENRLIQFFGDEYREYRKETRTLIPFIP
jgi:protein-S-isoprenylcysteine O-methyltransferase